MKKNGKIDQDHFWGYLLVAPTIIGLLVLNVYPFLQTIYLSFTNAKVFGVHKFVGLSNYIKMFTSEEFLRATWNTVFFCILTVPVGVLLPMVSPTLFVVLIMRLMASLKVYDLLYMMVGEGNPALGKAQSLIYLFYREPFVSGNRGYASAIVIWTVVLIGAVTLLQFLGQKKWVNYEV